MIGPHVVWLKPAVEWVWSSGRNWPLCMRLGCGRIAWDQNELCIDCEKSAQRLQAERVEVSSCPKN